MTGKKKQDASNSRMGELWNTACTYGKVRCREFDGYYWCDIGIWKEDGILLDVQGDVECDKGTICDAMVIAIEKARKVMGRLK